MPLIFVYGTLMRGGCRSGALSAEEFIGTARTQPRYRLYDCGSYPGLVSADDGVSVEGELWRVNEKCLLRLDEIEGVSEGLYERSRVDLAMPSIDQNVDAYFYLPDITHLPDIGNHWINHPP